MFGQPQLVAATLARIQEEHPYTAKGEITRSSQADADTTLLWDRLCGMDDGRLDVELSRLSEHEVRLVLYGAMARLRDPRCRFVFGRLLAVRRPAEAAPVAWVAWLVTNGEAPFHAQAAHHVRLFPMRTLWPRLVSSSTPLDAAILYYLQVEQPLDSWLKRPEVALHDETLVVTALRRRALTMPNLVGSCVIEKSGTLSQWLQTLIPNNEREATCRAYMVSTHQATLRVQPDRWKPDDPILGYVVDLHGEPKAKRPFWDDVARPVIAAVENWIKERQLTSDLGDGERLQFWRQFLPRMVRSFRSQEGDSVFICFDTWFAVQYRDMGRATYMFEKQLLASLSRKYEPRLYTTILLNHRVGNSVGRYEHRGYAWREEAQREVMRVLRRYSRPA